MPESFAEYRQRVLGYLGTRDPIRVQRATPAAVERRLRGRARATLTRRPAPGKWAISEIVGHMADAELAMGWRLRGMLATPGVALAWWDQERWADRLRYQARPAREAARLFRALREGNLQLLMSVPRAWWNNCYGVHEVRGRQTVAEFVALEAAHDLNHLRQIDGILSAPPSPRRPPVRGAQRIVAAAEGARRASRWHSSHSRPRRLPSSPF